MSNIVLATPARPSSVHATAKKAVTQREPAALAPVRFEAVIGSTL
jgi:hypothetical protein